MKPYGMKDSTFLELKSIGEWAVYHLCAWHEVDLHEFTGKLPFTPPVLC